ncbi:16022_t:CDS:1, partial [Gigaspora rosea]
PSNIIDEKEALQEQLNRYRKSTEKTISLIRKLSDKKHQLLLQSQKLGEDIGHKQKTK